MKIVVKQWIHTIKEYFLNFNLKKDNRPVIFLVCLVIATVLWLVNDLGKSYTTTVSIPIQYTNLPKNKVLVKAPPSRIKVRLEAYGFTLLRHKIKLSINPLNFNVGLFTKDLMEKSSASRYKIVTNKYIPQIANQISPEINILEVSPDTLYFVFDQIISQKKKVVENLDLSFENQFFLLDSISFTPDSVVVKGPKSIVDTLHFIRTKKQKFRELNASVRRNIQLESIDQLDIDPRRVVIDIPVSLYTEYTGNIPITKFNVPDSMELITFPPKIEVKCIVAFNNYANLNPSSFILGVDYSDISKGDNSLDIQLYRSPAHIKSISFQPHHVEFIIEKK